MYSLLIVDDEPRIRNGLVKSIDWNVMGFSTVESAQNGKEALQLAAEICADVIITDIRMPKMDGLQFIETLRSSGSQAQIIIISGYNDFQFAQQAIRYGVREYILKPINEADLCVCVEKILETLRGVESTTSAYTLTTEVQMTPNRAVNEALAYIHQHFREDISLIDVAAYVGVHQNYLSTLFSKICKKSFVSILSDCRMAQAKKLLMLPDIKIYEVAQRVGYSDYHWFAKTFKKAQGITPKQFIKRATQHADYISPE